MGGATALIHQGLADKALLPSTHLVDAGYVDAELLVNSRQQYGVDLLAQPARTTTGKPVTKRATQRLILSWTGPFARRCVRRESSVKVGPNTRKKASLRSLSNSRRRIVLRVFDSVYEG